MKRIPAFVIACLIYVNTVTAQASLTPVDGDSKIHFVIRNFSIKTGGDFTGISGTIKFDPEKYTTSSFDVTIDAATIDTDNSSRDDHLRKAEYFDVNTYKKILFKSKKITKSTIAGRFYVYGDLTIKGVTKPVEFGFGASTKNGGYVFDGEFKINRRDFAVGGSSISLSDNVIVSLAVFAK